MSPIKILLLAVLFYFLFKLMTSRQSSSKQKTEHTAAKSDIDDVLVEDPFCHTYIPQKEAEALNLEGKKYFFCSKKCLESFREANKSSKDSVN